ncbi:MAG: radical SAM protein [Clostridia bacterium]|nr:radical SAM protein [Clostridia bacterium]
MEHCCLCPRQCGRNRAAGEKGVCGVAGTQVLLGRAALHFWEEPCISGTRGSGAVFFAGCPLHCVYCQNEELSRARVGRAVTQQRLTEIFLELQAQGAHNINLVTPTHYLLQLIPALRAAKEQGLTVPVVYNTGGYERPEALALLRGLVDVYLPDFKYPDREGALRYSAAPDYPQVAAEAIRCMAEQTGPPVFDAQGLLLRGTIIRHLVLPDRTAETMRLLDELHDTYGDGVILSLMSQYTPMPACPCEELRRPVPPEQYERLVRYARRIGISRAYVQQGEAASAGFIPAFDGTGV